MSEEKNGAAAIDFSDYWGEKCVLQIDDCFGKPAIWFGLTAPHAHEPTGHIQGKMYLTQQHVQMLLPSLTKFAQTGKL